MITKQSLREKILILLRNQKEEERLSKSRSIHDKLFKMPEFQNAATVLFYASFDGEVNTFEMINQAKKLGKTIGLPRIIQSRNMLIPTLLNLSEDVLEDGPYGTKQPSAQSPTMDMADLDVVIVPGVAFDRQKNRLGRGGGYYDRFLKTLHNIPTIGLAFDFQIVDHLPFQEAHDVAVSCVLTN